MDALNDHNTNEDTDLVADEDLDDDDDDDDDDDNTNEDADTLADDDEGEDLKTAPVILDGTEITRLEQCAEAKEFQHMAKSRLY